LWRQNEQAFPSIIMDTVDFGDGEGLCLFKCLIFGMTSLTMLLSTYNHHAVINIIKGQSYSNAYSLALQTMLCSDFAYCMIVLSFTFIMLWWSEVVNFLKNSYAYFCHFEPFEINTCFLYFCMSYSYFILNGIERVFRCLIMPKQNYVSGTFHFFMLW
jgi:hypothetical protein